MKTKQTKATTELNTADIIDEIGSVMAIMADFSKRKAALVTELLSRAGDRKHIDGKLYTATIVPECVASVLDVEAITAEMGTDWIAAHSKDSVRKTSVRVTARKREDQKK